MRRIVSLLALTSLAFVWLVSPTEAGRRSKPWPDIHLSTLPAVVGQANSWAFEINERSPGYLVDLDKMYVSLAYGWGKNSNDLMPPEGELRYGYDFYNRGLDYKIFDFDLNIYSNLGAQTYGSMWVSYGKREDRTLNVSIVTSVPADLRVKAAFAWTLNDRLALAASGSFGNWPRSLVFVFQPQDTENPQKDLPADVGENLVGVVDLLYRPSPDLDLIFGGEFQSIYTKYNPPQSSGFNDDGTVSTVKDTAEVKEYVYSGGPRFIVKKSFKKGDYIRFGASYHLHLFDYQYRGAKQYSTPSEEYPSYRLQDLATMIPKWRLFADGTKLLGSEGALYIGGELGGYPNVLEMEDTEFAPVRLSLVNLVDLTAGKFTIEMSGKLTRILHGMAGLELRYLDTGDSDPFLVDDRSLYASLKLGTTTRFYRNLWWSIRVPSLRFYSSDALGSAVLFGNRSFIETEILFLGL